MIVKDYVLNKAKEAISLQALKSACITSVPYCDSIPPLHFHKAFRLPMRCRFISSETNDI